MKSLGPGVARWASENTESGCSIRFYAVWTLFSKFQSPSISLELKQSENESSLSKGEARYSQVGLRSNITSADSVFFLVFPKWNCDRLPGLLSLQERENPDLWCGLTLSLTTSPWRHNVALVHKSVWGSLAFLPLHRPYASPWSITCIWFRIKLSSGRMHLCCT